MHGRELSIPWSFRLSRDVPIEPLPMALPLSLTGPSELVKTERTGPVTSRLLQADSVDVLRKHLGPGSEPDDVRELK